MTTQEEPRVTQADEEWAEEVASAANIVTNGGYYEIDIDAVTLVIARHRQSAEAASKAQVERLREALAFYAQERNWRASGMYMCGHAPDSACAKDGGNRARAALSASDTDGGDVA